MKDYTNSQICALIDEHIHNARDRDLLKARFCDGIIFEQLSENYDLSVQRTKAIVYAAQKILIRYL